MRYFYCAFILLMIAMLTACGILAPDNDATTKSNLSRDTAPDISTIDLQTLLDGNNSFAFDFYRRVQGIDGNLVYSPYSIFLAGAMLYGGASGETAAQIAKTLHFTLPPEQFHPTMNSLS